MITVAIVGVLAAIAYPSYTSYVQRSKRTMAKTELMSIAQLQERYYIDNRTYGLLSLIGRGTALNTIGIDEDGGIVALGAGIYDITMTAASASTFTAQATAKNTQTSDTACTTLTYTAAGVKAPAACW
jgi:type IV pilus assembly protein PilE